MGAHGDVLGRIEQHKEGSGNDTAPVSHDQPLFGDPLSSMAQEKAAFSGQPASEQAEPRVKREEVEEDEEL